MPHNKNINVIDPIIINSKSNPMETQPLDLSHVSAKDLKEALAKKEKAEKQAREREKKQYEAERDADMVILIDEALIASEQLRKFKSKAHTIMEKYAQKLADYGKIRSNSKGGFSLKTNDGKIKIRRRRDTLPSWDERSEKALELIKDFLQDTIKKRDIKLFEILYSFIARNKAGDLEYSKVMNLLTHEDKYDDPRWIEGLKLLKESYSNHLRGYQYDFETLNLDSKKYERLNLNFSNL